MGKEWGSEKGRGGRRVVWGLEKRRGERGESGPSPMGQEEGRRKRTRERRGICGRWEGVGEDTTLLPGRYPSPRHLEPLWSYGGSWSSGWFPNTPALAVSPVSGSPVFLTREASRRTRKRARLAGCDGKNRGAEALVLPV